VSASPVLKIGQIYMRPCGLSVCFDLNPLSVTANMHQCAAERYVILIGLMTATATAN